MDETEIEYISRFFKNFSHEKQELILDTARSLLELQNNYPILSNEDNQGE